MRTVLRPSRRSSGGMGSRNIGIPGCWLQGQACLLPWMSWGVLEGWDCTTLPPSLPPDPSLPFTDSGAGHYRI